MKKQICLILTILSVWLMTVPAIAELTSSDTGEIDGVSGADVVAPAKPGAPTSSPEPTSSPVPTEAPTETPAATKAPYYGGGGGYIATPKPTATATPTEAPTQAPAETVVFGDVDTSAWYYNDVVFVSSNKLMSGVSDDEFAPDNTLTRAMLITILYRMAGEPQGDSNTFTDVTEGSWYEKAVSWGVQNNIVKGVGEGLFAPDNNITREQLAVMMYNYSGADNADSKLDIYADGDKVSVWATAAVSWAVNNKIINGKGNNTLAPADFATRAEAAAIIKRFVNLKK